MSAVEAVGRMRTPYTLEEEKREERKEGEKI